MFGQLWPCPKCNQQSLVAKGLNEAESKVRFDQFQTDGRPGAAKMVQAAKKFIGNHCIGFLSIHGGFGNGKTTLMHAIANECAELGIPSQYITMTEVMIYAKEAFQNQQATDSDYGRITKLAKTRVLLIDELDKANLKEYGREVQNYLFNFRYRNAKDLGTVLAWNGDFNTIDLPAVLSRLSEFVVMRNDDADMRPLLGERL
jgi:DNA replication protein DnaC